MRQVVTLDEHDVRALPPALRHRLLREQVTADRRLVPSLQSVPQEWRSGVAADSAARRFVWWPSTLQTCGDEPLLDFVREEAGRSDHGRVLATTWARAEAVLPRARRLAGTFADASGPNCFGTVMAAAGVPGASETQVVREPFESWLADRTRPGRDDDRPGTVLVWRDQQGAVQHAAVTLGDGWALHKPSQGWMTARVVLPVREVIRATRQPGHRLSRRTVTDWPVAPHAAAFPVLRSGRCNRQCDQHPPTRPRTTLRGGDH
ncbi:hypothetical protein [Lapillicoccus jejuensis]|uniref:hypothetical protein n=1 Tax=Lapillicoccus jejuensis TaxID=402171 RepID=UPI001150D36D|nr:hypothetical protein [Lapillicoccus jejuensis]